MAKDKDHICFHCDQIITDKCKDGKNLSYRTIALDRPWRKHLEFHKSCLMEIKSEKTIEEYLQENYERIGEY